MRSWDRPGSSNSSGQIDDFFVAVGGKNTRAAAVATTARSTWRQAHPISRPPRSPLREILVLLRRSRGRLSRSRRGARPSLHLPHGGLGGEHRGAQQMEFRFGVRPFPSVERLHGELDRQLVGGEHRARGGPLDAIPLLRQGTDVPAHRLVGRSGNLHSLRFSPTSCHDGGRSSSGSSPGSASSRHNSSP